MLAKFKLSSGSLVCSNAKMIIPLQTYSNICNIQKAFQSPSGCFDSESRDQRATSDGGFPEFLWYISFIMVSKICDLLLHDSLSRTVAIKLAHRKTFVSTNTKVVLPSSVHYFPYHENKPQMRSPKLTNPNWLYDKNHTT